MLFRSPHIVDLDVEMLARLQATRLRDITGGEKMQDDAEVSDGERRRRDLERKAQSERREDELEDFLERFEAELDHAKEMRQIDRKREKNRLDDDKREWRRLEKAEKEKLSAAEADAKMLRKKQEEAPKR